jgi:hypothetical protein
MFEFLIESFPPNWTFERRGEALLKKSVSVKSDNNGAFRIDIVGHSLWLTKAEKPGFRHFYDLATGNSEAVDNTFYGINSWGDLCYKSDTDHQATFVFVKDGAKEVSALPCRGGYDSGNGKHWTENKPGWPKKPSLPDVVQKQREH